MSEAFYLPICEFDTIEAGYTACNIAGRGFPFVVRHANMNASETSIRCQIRLEKKIKGYAGGLSHTLSGLEALTAFDDGSLTFNVVDSASTRGHSALLPIALAKIGKESDIRESLWLAYVISPASIEIGCLHNDPCLGSGWQYLASGRKQWYIIDDKNPAFSLSKYNATEASQVAPNMVDIASSMGKEKIFSTVIETGDFISCPMNWPHAVFTFERTLGLSGYTATPELRLIALANAAIASCNDDKTV